MEPEASEDNDLIVLCRECHAALHAEGKIIGGSDCGKSPTARFSRQAPETKRGFGAPTRTADKADMVATIDR